MHRRLRWLAIVAMYVAIVPWAAHAHAKDLDGFGVVLMHGKGGNPESNLIAPLTVALEANGALVIAPLMPWYGSQGRPQVYAETYDQAMQTIEHAAAALRAKGASKIIVAGQSLGANAALGYGARHGHDLAGIMALAPGHVPELPKFRALVRDGVARAKELAASGQGDTLVSLPDTNQGETFQVRAKPAAYLSYFDPEGPAVIPRNAARMPAIPLLWVIGKSDPLYALGAGYAYARAPKHGKSRYVVVNAGHRDTPAVARPEIIAWLKSL